MIQLFYQNNKTGDTWDIATIASTITFKTVRQGSAWSLEVEVYNSTKIEFEHGSPIAFKKDDKELFFGYLTKIKYSKDAKVTLTFHDQKKYLLRNINFVAKDKNVNQIVSAIAEDFSLKVGELKGSSAVLSPQLKEDKKALDIIQEAMDESLVQSGELLVLFDKFGELTLTTPKNLPIQYIIGNESFLTEFDYESSIEDSANIVRLVQENKKTKKREVYIYKDSYNIGAWGKLQYMKKVDEKATEGQIKQWGEMLLKLKNRPKETLSLSSDIGSTDFLAGHAVYIDVKDINKKGWYVIEEATHTFEDNKHSMEIKLFMAEGNS